MSTISQQQLQGIFKKAESSGKKLDRAQLVQELVNRGHEIEGLNTPAKQKEPGIFSTLMTSLNARNQAAFGTDKGLLQALGGNINPNSALGRMGTGQQGAMDTVLQIGGQGAGAISDVVGAGLGLGGRAVSALTPDSIERPIVDTAKAALQGVAESPIGQAVGGAVGAATDLYGQFKDTQPVAAANIEAVGNIGSMLPIGKASQAGKQVLSGADDVAKGLAKPLRESAEASVSRVLNPTTNATKAATQKIAGELVDRPLKDTLSLTRKGMQAKAGAAAEVAGEAIQAAGPLPGKSRTKDLINYLQKQKDDFMAGGKVVNREGVGSIDEVTDLVAQYGKEVDDEVLRDIRRIFDAEFYQGKKNIAKSAAETSTLNFKKKAADEIRRILGDKYPDIAALNKEYTFWSNLEDVLGKTVARKTGQKGAIKAVATIGGAAAGQGVAGSLAGALAFRTVASMIDSPAWGFVSAKVKNRLAEALASSNLSDIGQILGSLPGLTAAQALPDEQ